MKTYFLHARDFANAGDISCCPYEYFDFLRKHECVFVDLTGNNDRHGPSGMYWTDVVGRVTKDDVVIVGGGGLAGYVDSWHEAINAMSSRAGRAIGWGFGENFAGERKTRVPLDLASFDLVGTRDFKDNASRYVPCASCMHPQFRCGRRKVRGRGIVLHRDAVTRPRPALFEGADVVCNSMDVRRLMEFISGCEEVYSNSYHACYWAALFNVPVRNLDESPNRKFLRARFDYHGGDNSGFYEECVEISTKFAEEARDVIV